VTGVAAVGLVLAGGSTAAAHHGPKPPKPAASLPNLVRKGSFEHPRVALDMSVPFESIPGWRLAFGDRIEVGAGDAAVKRQYVELDSDASSGIYQLVPTEPHHTYRLQFFFSPRPGTSRAENVLVVRWHSKMVAEITADGRKLRHAAWRLYTLKLQVKAPGTSTMLEFDDAGISDSVGTLIDGVRVTQWKGGHAKTAR